MAINTSIPDIQIWSDWKLENIEIQANKTFHDSVGTIKGSAQLKTPGTSIPLELSFQDGKLSKIDISTKIGKDFTLGGVEVDVQRLKFNPDVNPNNDDYWEPEIELRGNITLPEELGYTSLDLIGDNKLVLRESGLELVADIQLPKTNFSLANLLEVTADDLSLGYSLSSSTVDSFFTIQGKVSIPSLYNASAGISELNPIKINNSGVSFGGTLSLERIPIVKGKWELKNTTVSLDTQNKTVSAFGTLLLPTGNEISVHEIEFVQGSTPGQQRLNSIQLGITNLNQPLSAFGAGSILYLQDIGGGVSNLASSAPNPTFNGNVKITAGPQVNIKLPNWAGGNFSGSLLELKVKGDLNQDRLEADSTITFANGLITGTGNAQVNWAQDSISLTTKFDALGGLIASTANFKFNSNLDCNAVFETSINFPRIGSRFDGYNLASAKGVFQYTNDGINSNDFILVAKTVDLLLFDFTLGFRVNFDGTFTTVGSKEIEQATQQSTQGEGSISSDGTLYTNGIALDNASLYQSVEQALPIAQEYLQNFVTSANASTTLNLAFGNTWNIERATILSQALANQDFSLLPSIEIRSSASIGNANAAFAETTNTIYLASEYLSQNQSNPEAIASVLLEEIGHWLDAELNTSDAPGDEGAIFSALVRGELLTEQQLAELKAENDTVLITLDGTGTQLNHDSSSGAQATFNVGVNTPWLLFSVGWENPVDWQNAVDSIPIQLQAPDGTIYTAADIVEHDSIGIIGELSNATHGAIGIKNPTSGEWTLRILDTTGLGNVEFSALGGTNAPTIEITSLTQNPDQTVSINYNATDIDSDAKISFFYDTDQQGFDGFLIADGITEADGAGSYTWNPQQLSGGEYYLYAMIQDNDSAPGFNYFTTPIPLSSPSPMQGTAGSAPMIGTDSDNLLFGYPGNDMLTVGGGTDPLLYTSL